MDANDVQTLYETVIFYDIFKKTNDDTQIHIATTHIPDLAIMFCEEHKDCIIKRNYSTARLTILEESYRGDEE